MNARIDCQIPYGSLIYNNNAVFKFRVSSGRMEMIFKQPVGHKIQHIIFEICKQDHLCAIYHWKVYRSRSMDRLNILTPQFFTQLNRANWQLTKHGRCLHSRNSRASLCSLCYTIAEICICMHICMYMNVILSILYMYVCSSRLKI